MSDKNDSGMKLSIVFDTDGEPLYVSREPMQIPGIPVEGDHLPEVEGVFRTVVNDAARECSVVEGWAAAEMHKDRAEKAEAELHEIESVLDNAGVARSTAPTVDACTNRDTPDRYPRLTLSERVKILAKSERDILDRLLDADAAKDKAEAERNVALKHEEDAANESAKLAEMIYGTASQMGVLDPHASCGQALRAMLNAYMEKTAKKG